MLKCTATLRGVSPLIQSRFHGLEREKNQTWEDFEKGIFKEKLHYDDDGNVFITPAAVKKSIMWTASYLGDKLKGKLGTLTKHFRAGVLVTTPMYLGIKKDDVGSVWIDCSSQPSKPNSPLVKRLFPQIEKWEGTVNFTITDEEITKDIFKRHLEKAGLHDGLGSFRVGNGGSCGAFEVVKVKWE